MDGQLELTEHVGPTPEATIREAFLRFHRENPHVYDELVRLARAWRERRGDRLGIGMLYEVMRWNLSMRVATGGDIFKLNNNYRSYYARLIMRKNPDLVDVFEIRRLHGRGLGEDDA